MPESATISIESADPRTPEVTAMIHALDRYMADLYPAESNHLVDIETLAKRHVKFFAVKVDGTYRGCGAILVHGREYAEVKRVYVAPEARGLGLGRRIIERLERATRDEGLAVMRLETGISQPEALGLFAAAGFRKCGPFGDYPMDDPYSVFMEKQL